MHDAAGTIPPNPPSPPCLCCAARALRLWWVCRGRRYRKADIVTPCAHLYRVVDGPLPPSSLFLSALSFKPHVKQTPPRGWLLVRRLRKKDSAEVFGCQFAKRVFASGVRPGHACLRRGINDWASANPVLSNHPSFFFFPSDHSVSVFGRVTILSIGYLWYINR